MNQLESDGQGKTWEAPETRSWSTWGRTFIWVLLAVFGLVTVVTTAVSFGRYCLTTEAPKPAPFAGTGAGSSR